MLKAGSRTVAALLALAAAVVLGLHAAGVIGASTALLATAVVVSAVLAAVSTIGGAWSAWRAERLGARRELADVQLTAALWAIVDQVGGALDFRDLGLAAYRVERVWYAPWQRVLTRVHRVRARRRPVASDIRWAPGKGVAGQCVTRGQVVATDLTRLYAGLGTPTRAEWDTQVPSDVRMGLTYDEFLDVHQKYDVVVASPVIDDSGRGSSVRGCVVLDGPDGSFALLTSDEVLGLLDSAASGLLLQAL